MFLRNYNLNMVRYDLVLISVPNNYTGLSIDTQNMLIASFGRKLHRRKQQTKIERKTRQRVGKSGS